MSGLGPCGFRGCGHRVSKRGLCNGHYLQVYRGQTPRPLRDHYGTVAERFWRKVEKSDGCWKWSGSRSDKGYGRLHTATGVVLAARISWEIHHGPVADGLWVLHHCDNPPCVNPAHLFLGTPKDNTRDMIAKGRQNFAGLDLGRGWRRVA